jgi:triosephosphate isomerase
MNGSLELVNSVSTLLSKAEITNSIIFCPVALVFNGILADVVLAPPALYTVALQKKLATDNPRVQVALQNIYEKPSGAFTGELSTAMMIDLGFEWTLIGHSERRKYFNETDQVSFIIHSCGVI